MNKHTPGPWKHVIWKKNLSENPSVLELKDMLTSYIDKTIASGDSVPDFHMVLQEHGWDSEDPIAPAMVGNGPKSEANARLIAAAPDMLQYLIDVYKSGGVFDEAEMRAVIEAATGQKIEEVVK